MPRTIDLAKKGVKKEIRIEDLEKPPIEVYEKGLNFNINDIEQGTIYTFDFEGKRAGIFKSKGVLYFGGVCRIEKATMNL